MITTAEERRSSNRVFGAAVLLSICVHLLGFALYDGGRYLRALLHVPQVAQPTPPPVEVSLSRSITINKKKKPVPVPIPRTPDRRPQPQHVPQPKVVAATAIRPSPQAVKVAAAPSPPPKARALHELAKTVAKAPPNAEKTVHATPPPQRRVAFAPKPAPVESSPPQTPAPNKPARESQRSPQSNTAQQIARVDRDMARALSAMRHENDPLATRPASPSAQRKYQVQMLGALGDLHNYQGHCDAIKEWEDGAYDYYYETCNVQFSDGTAEEQSVPWPIRYVRGKDPMRGDLGIHEFPLPGPMPGFKLGRGQYVSKELRQYAHEHGVDI